MNASIVEQVLLAVGMLALLLVPFYWHRVLGLATALQRTGGRVHDEEIGLAELALPRGWKSTNHLKGNESIRMTDRFGRRYVIVISDARQDFADHIDLSEFHGLTFSQLVRAGDIVEMGAATARKVGDLDALQSEVVLILQRRFVTKYLHTTLLGRRGFHQVIGWSAESIYDRSLFETVVDGFRERPGPPSISRSTWIPGSESGYDVH